MQKSSKFLLTISLLIWFSSPMAEAVNRIIAVVDDNIISKADLENRINLAILSAGLEASATTRKQLEPQVLQVMIDELLKISKAKQFDIRASDNDIEQAIKEIEHRNHMKEETLKKLLQNNNIPLSILKTQVAADLVWRDYIQARYHNAIQISEKELDRAMEKFAKKKDKRQFLLAEIFLDVDNPSQAEEVHKRAWDFVRKLREGANFSAIAQQFSQAASAFQSGDIDWVAEDQLDPALKQALEGLSLGNITDPIKTQYGYHILLLRDHRAAGESLGKDTLISFMQILFPISQPFTEENVAAIMSKARTLANSAKNCAILSKLAKSDQNIQTREAKKLSMTSLVPHIRKLVAPLQAGQSTEPLLTDMGVIMFTVCEKEDINPDNLTRDQVRLTLIDEKLNNLAKGELREARRRAHIEIRE